MTIMRSKGAQRRQEEDSENGEPLGTSKRHETHHQPKAGEVKRISERLAAA